MTTIERVLVPSGVRSSRPAAPPSAVVLPWVSVAVRWRGGRLLLVRRCDDGTWELPGGRVGAGETAVEAAVRSTAEGAGVQVLVTGIAGLFTDPRHVTRSPGGVARRQFAVLLHARAVGGAPRGDLRETSEAAWVAVVDIAGLAMQPCGRFRVAHALAVGDPPLLG
jgi:ADP-ribose pyrophosphatase YjhB (NUDIX family)